MSGDYTDVQIQENTYKVASLAMGIAIIVAFLPLESHLRKLHPNHIFCKAMMGMTENNERIPAAANMMVMRKT